MKTREQNLKKLYDLFHKDPANLEEQIAAALYDIEGELGGSSFYTNEEQTTSLFKALKNNTTISSLYINGDYQKINYGGMIALGAMLEKNTNIKKLVLTNVKLDASMIRLLFGGIGTNNTLKTLVIAGCDQIDEKGAEIISSKINENNSLKELYIERSIAPKGFIPIANGLKSNKTLEKVSLWRNLDNERTMRIMKEVLYENNTLSNVGFDEILYGQEISKEEDALISDISNLLRCNIEKTEKPEFLGSKLTEKKPSASPSISIKNEEDYKKLEKELKKLEEESKKLEERKKKRRNKLSQDPELLAGVSRAKTRAANSSSKVDKKSKMIEELVKEERDLDMESKEIARKRADYEKILSERPRKEGNHRNKVQKSESSGNCTIL